MLYFADEWGIPISHTKKYLFQHNSGTMAASSAYNHSLPTGLHHVIFTDLIGFIKKKQHCTSQERVKLPMKDRIGKDYRYFGLRKVIISACRPLETRAPISSCCIVLKSEVETSHVCSGPSPTRPVIHKPS